MKRKILYSTILVIGILFYAISFIATSKQAVLDPCYERTAFWLYKDSTRSRHTFLAYNNNDTVVLEIDTTYAIHANTICDTICGMYKDSCNRAGIGILVINSNDTARSTWETRYGKKLFFRQCP
ncbi:hypothetical protein [Ferruginibacter sp. SUN106]|uniref:hypothetical protein n=1 Tax=Ferruginibacter sp. SUN106 TaxID=2978348 RepID=UPI003D36F853